MQQRNQSPCVRVLHVIPGVAPRYGGPSRAILAMCQALESQGVESLIATTDADGRGRLRVELGCPITYQGVKTVFFSRQWSEAFKYSRPLARWLESAVKSFDLVHIDAIFSHSSLAAARACLRHGVPYVLRPLGSLDPWSLNQKRLRKRLLWHCGVKQMLCGAAAIHYATVEERRLAESALGLARGVVIPLGIDEEALSAPVARDRFRQQYTSLEKNPYALVLCRLHPKKGLELLLEVFLDLTQQQEFQHWRLVVAGDGEARYVASLKHLAREREGDGRVLFTGWLDGAEKAAALQEAALLALPSYQENFGLSVAEAMACGVPVLVSTHVNLAEEIRAARAGWVMGLERSALLRTLVDALRDKGERASRGAAGQNLARSRFTWPSIAVELTQMYRSAIELGRNRTS